MKGSTVGGIAATGARNERAGVMDKLQERGSLQHQLGRAHLLFELRPCA